MPDTQTQSANHGETQQPAAGQNTASGNKLDLSKKVGPAPLWVWLALAGVVILYFILSKRGKSSSSGSSDSSGGGDAASGFFEMISTTKNSAHSKIHTTLPTILPKPPGTTLPKKVGSPKPKKVNIYPGLPFISSKVKNKVYPGAPMTLATPAHVHNQRVVNLQG
jgi:hypothetical protein